MEEWISNLEDGMVEITAEEQNKGKRIKRIEDSLWDHWDNGKCANIWIIGIPEEEGKTERHWGIFWRNYSWKFPNMGKEIVNQVQEMQSPL